jgi:hypothetical protein
LGNGILDLGKFLEIHCDGLLDDQMLASLGGTDRFVRMEDVGRADIDNIHIVSGEQCFVVVEDVAVQAEFVFFGLSRFSLARGQSSNPQVRISHYSFDMLTGDPANTEYTNAESSHCFIS